MTAAPEVLTAELIVERERVADYLGTRVPFSSGLICNEVVTSCGGCPSTPKADLFDDRYLIDISFVLIYSASTERKRADGRPHGGLS